MTSRNDLKQLLLKNGVTTGQIGLVFEVLTELIEGVNFSKTRNPDRDQDDRIKKTFLESLQSICGFLGLKNKKMTQVEQEILELDQFFGRLVLSRLTDLVEDQITTEISDAVDRLFVDEVHPELPDDDGVTELYIVCLINDYKKLFKALVLSYFNETSFKISLDICIILLACRFFWVLGLDDDKDDEVCYFARS